MVSDSGCRKIAEVIIIGNDEDTRGAIMTAAEEWSAVVSHLSLPFLMLLLMVIFFVSVRITSLST